MLKIRTFLVALLGVSPLLFLSWQLPNQATVLPTNDNESGTLSEYPTPIAQASPPSTFDSPSKGPAGSLSGGATTGSSATVFSQPIINIAPPVAASPSVSVSVSPAGVVSITVTPAATLAINVAAANIISAAAGGAAAGGGTTGGGTTGGGTTGGGTTGGGTTGGGTTGGGTTEGGTTGGGTTGGGDQGTSTVVALAVSAAEAPAALVQLTSALSAAGASPTLVNTLLENIAGLLVSAGPSAKLPQGQLVAGTKALKNSLTIAQTSTAPNVDINKLNNAINAYNQIILESSPVVLQKLAQDKDFLEIGRTLKTLRSALK
ncbi:MAG: hypothetical protein ACKO11_01510 [Cuspidothrix sp.]